MSYESEIYSTLLIPVTNGVAFRCTFTCRSSLLALGPSCGGWLHGQ